MCMEHARSFFDSDRAAVLNVGAGAVIGFVKQHVVELSPINYFSALRTLVGLSFLRFGNSSKCGSYLLYESTLQCARGRKIDCVFRTRIRTGRSCSTGTCNSPV